jgi:hypothetical protein
MAITGCIMYTTDKNGWIDDLCVNNVELNKTAILIPHIGETFIDKSRNVEYEVKDIIRFFDGKEYCIQVRLHERERRKYK